MEVLGRLERKIILVDMVAFVVDVYCMGFGCSLHFTLRFGKSGVSGWKCFDTKICSDFY